MEDIAIAVVISTLDRPETLSRCLEALATGSFRPSEVVVVDQSSTASAAPIVAAGASMGLPIRHRLQARRGLSASQNLGVASVSAPYVAVVDDDCVPDAHWLANGARRLREPDRPDLVTGPVLPLPPDGDKTAAVSTRDGTDPRVFRWPALAWHVGTGGNFLVARERYLAIGGNDERLGTGTAGRAGNDVDLFHRLLRAGAVAAYEPSFLVHHERSTPGERRKRRWSYGFGIGACVGKWLREGDRRSVIVLAHWLRLRLHLARHGALQDELRVIAGTAGGFAYGIRLTGAALPPDEHEPKPLRALPARRQLATAIRPLRAIGERLDPSPAALRRRAARIPLPPLTVISIYRRPNATRTAALIDDLPDGTEIALWSLDEGIDTRLASYTIGAGPGPRVMLLNTLAARCDERSWLLVTDDDVELPPGGVADLLAAAAIASLDVCQPAHTRSSVANWRFTRRRALSVTRETRFVESGPTVLFSPRARRVLFPLPLADGMGWGLEATWGDPRHGLRLGIVDAVRIEHHGPVADAYERTDEEARGAAALASIGLRAWPELQTTSRIWRPWRRDPGWS